MKPPIFTPVLVLGLAAAACGDPASEPSFEADAVRSAESEEALAEALAREAELEDARATTVAALPFRRITESRFFDDGSDALCIHAVDGRRVDVHRSLFVHDLATLGDGVFALTRTLDQLAEQINRTRVRPRVSAEALFRDLWDTQNHEKEAVTPEGAQCSDNDETINGFPYSCPRAEGVEARRVTRDHIDDYIPIALVNRFDLAHEGWLNCGEYRIIYALTDRGPVPYVEDRPQPSGRNFIIFEAVLPNPSPGCKDGCRPVAEFWAGLSLDENPASRTEKLSGFFYEGLPGFNPVVHVDHYSSKGTPSGYTSAGGGQIRTNQFMQGPWTLKEFRTLIDCDRDACEFQFVPDTVKLNPFARLWSPYGPGDDFDGRALEFRAAIAAQVDELGSGSHPASLSYALEDRFNGAQSEVTNALPVRAPPTQGDTDYCAAFDCGTKSHHYLAAPLAAFNAETGANLTATHIVNRATALACAGCHQPTTFGLHLPEALGPEESSKLRSWPLSAGFVHVNEQSLVPMPNPAVFGGLPGFALSPALTDAFLPARRDVLERFLAEPDCACGRVIPVPIPPIDVSELVPFVPQTPIDLESSLELHALDLELEHAFEDAAEQANVEVRPLHPRVTDAPAIETLGVTDGLTDPRARATARAEAIREHLANVPPRRTVTGSFAVH